MFTYYTIFEIDLTPLVQPLKFLVELTIHHYSNRSVIHLLPFQSYVNYQNTRICFLSLKLAPLEFSATQWQSGLQYHNHKGDELQKWRLEVERGEARCHRIRTSFLDTYPSKRIYTVLALCNTD